MRIPTVIIIVALFLSPILLSYDTNQSIAIIEDSTPSSLQGWLSGWEYRKSHTIEGSLGAGFNYPIQLTVHYGSGIDTDSEVFCDAKCLPDFGDIRFADNDGTTLLDYWNESNVALDHAVFWVEIADNLNTSQDIYIYYGNSSATTMSNSTTTFLFFDDFENGDFSKWNSSGDWSIDSTYKSAGEFGAYTPGRSGSESMTRFINQTESFLVSFDARTFDNFNTFPGLFSTNAGTCYSCTLGWTDTLYYDGGYHSWPQNSSLSYDTWYTIEIGFNLVDGRISGWKNSSYMGEVVLVSETTGQTPTEVTSFRPKGGTQSTRHLAMDNVMIRKWIPSEPGHGVWGFIETELPAIDSPSDLVYEAGTTSNTITWSPSASSPSFYEVYLDSDLHLNETWDGSAILVSVDGLDPGTYNFEIRVFDSHADYATDTVYVVVEDTTNPIITHPPDVIYNGTTSGSIIQWTPTDLYPASYMIILDNESLYSGAWNTSGELIQISIDGLSEGQHTYNLTVIDQSGNLASDLVHVLVIPIQLGGVDLIVYVLTFGGGAIIIVGGALVCRSRRPAVHAPASYDW